MKIEIEIRTDNAAFWSGDGEPNHNEIKDIINTAFDKAYQKDYSETAIVLVDSNGNPCGFFELEN